VLNRSSGTRSVGGVVVGAIDDLLEVVAVEVADRSTRISGGRYSLIRESATAPPCQQPPPQCAGKVLRDSRSVCCTSDRRVACSTNWRAAAMWSSSISSSGCDVSLGEPAWSGSRRRCR
jgi:hypothetical protein